MSSSMILEMCASSSSVSLAALDFGSAIAFDHVYKGCQSILEWSDSQPEDMQTQTSTFVPSVPASVNINIELPQECPPSLCPYRIERDLRKTIDERSKRRIDAHRVLFEENRKLRLELSSLQDVLRSSRQTNDGDADASVAALEKERDARLQIEARMLRTVDTLRTEIAQLSEAKTVAEEAHRNAQRDAAYWEGKALDTLERCGTLEQENFDLKMVVHTFAKDSPSVLTQQLQAMVGFSRDDVGPKKHATPSRNLFGLGGRQINGDNTWLDQRRWEPVLQ